MDKALDSISSTTKTNQPNNQKPHDIGAAAVSVTSARLQQHFYM
jgi:hypothetical protein